MKALIPILLLATACSPNRTINPLSESEIKILSEFRSMSSASRVQTAESTELGEKLWLCLTFVDKENNQVLKNQRVHFYQANIDGEYHPSDPTNETTARINGESITDESGRMLVQTILPGDYGSSRDNRHIHTTVFDAHPEPYDIHFEQYTKHGIGRITNRRSDQFFLADLKQHKDGFLVTFLTIEVKNPKITKP